jgi:ATP-binding protein involved in chromosome partitioning
MATQDDVMAALAQVQDPELHRSIVDLGMVHAVAIDGDRVRVGVKLTVSGCPLTQRIRQEIQAAVGALPGVAEVAVDLGVMTPEELKAVSYTLRGDAAGPSAPSPFSGEGVRTRVLIVASGKGGVGKSTVAANLAAALAARGRSVGLLDADIAGFSVPRIIGLTEAPRVITDGVIIPPEAAGVKVISMGSLVEERAAVVWRGPMLSKMVTQFLTEVQWGEPDYLVVDSPPGTGDVAITLQGQLPKGLLVLVTTPQTVASAVAARLLAMARKTGQHVAGVVENMAYFVCGHCGERTEVFAGAGGEDVARALGVPLLGRLPILPDLAAAADRGEPPALFAPGSEAGRAFLDLARAVEGLSVGVA